MGRPRSYYPLPFFVVMTAMVAITDWWALYGFGLGLLTAIVLWGTGR